MRVFISWSGDRSRQVAEALHDWLPSVIQAVHPWMSANDIEKGTRWRSGLANELEQASVSIICLTPENLESPWINFEAGALSKQQQNTCVCTFLFGLEPIDVREPLAQFQATKSERGDVKKLVHTINRIQDASALPEGKINEAFDVWWPKLEERLSKIQTSQERLAYQTSDSLSPQSELEYQRGLREILAEILELVRAQSRESRRPPKEIEARRRLIKGDSLSTRSIQLLAEHFDLPPEQIQRVRFDADEVRELLKVLRAKSVEQLFESRAEIVKDNDSLSPKVEGKTDENIGS